MSRRESTESISEFSVRPSGWDRFTCGAGRGSAPRVPQSGCGVRISEVAGVARGKTPKQHVV
jgi:hypothetical protein